MSDSLKATVIVIVLVLTISANGELELAEVVEELEPPRPPAVVPAVPAVDELDEDVLLDVEAVEALAVDPAETESPGERLASDTIVPVIGAYSLVAASAVFAVLTLASALYTAACAEATLPAGDAVPPELPEPVEPLAVEPLAPDPDPDPVEPLPADGVCVDELGVVVAVGAVVVCLVVEVVVWGVVVVLVVGVVCVVVVVVGAVLVSDTNTVVPELEPVLRLAVAVVVDVEAAVCAALSWSSAAVRSCSAWSTASWAEVESSVASSWPLVTC
jgi:hypothetical protein